MLKTRFPGNNFKKGGLWTARPGRTWACKAAATFRYSVAAFLVADFLNRTYCLEQLGRLREREPPLDCAYALHS
jgi:hypothetical protein